MAIIFGLIFMSFLMLGSGENQDQGECYSWGYTDVFFIKQSSLAESVIGSRVESRSFVECCVKCDVAQGCSGVAFREGECCLITGTADGFVSSDGSGDDYKVMMYNTNADGQDAHNCVGDCDACPLDSRPDCQALHDLGYTSNGVYRIRGNTAALDAYCDMSDGGWTVIQRRVDGSVDFYRGWADYLAGFGDPSGNFWAGLDNIHQLTSGATTELYVSMSTFEGESAWARYSSFSVGDAASGYLMTVSGYSGTAGDSMAKHNNMKFTTFDKDQDAYGGNCAVLFKGAWWYTACHDSNPNGLYDHGTATDFAVGINWASYKGHNYSLKTMELKVRKVA